MSEMFRAAGRNQLRKIEVLFSLRRRNFGFSRMARHKQVDDLHTAQRLHASTAARTTFRGGGADKAHAACSRHLS